MQVTKQNTDERFNERYKGREEDVTRAFQAAFADTIGDLTVPDYLHDRFRKMNANNSREKIEIITACAGSIEALVDPKKIN